MIPVLQRIADAVDKLAYARHHCAGCRGDGLRRAEREEEAAFQRLKALIDAERGETPLERAAKEES